MPPEEFVEFAPVQSYECNGTPLQYSCLENPMDGGAWWAAAHGVAKSQTRVSDLAVGAAVLQVNERAQHLQIIKIVNPTSPL